jgi:hypothetical protein
VAVRLNLDSRSHSMSPPTSGLAQIAIAAAVNLFLLQGFHAVTKPSSMERLVAAGCRSARPLPPWRLTSRAIKENLDLQIMARA